MIIFFSLVVGTIPDDVMDEKNLEDEIIEQWITRRIEFVYGNISQEYVELVTVENT